MDIQKLLEWGTEYFSDYVAVFISTLTRPTARFQPVSSHTESSLLVSSGERVLSYSGPQLNPRLFGFLIISIFIGATLNSIIPARPTAPDMVTTATVTLVVWFAYSLLIHAFSKMLGGRGKIGETLSVSLQLLAVIYVVSNFSTLLIAVLVRLSLVYNLLTGRNVLLDALADTPIAFYYAVHFLLMFFYLPLALKYVHGFGLTRQILSTIFPLIIGTSCGIIVFLATAFTSPFVVAPTALAPIQPSIVLPTLTPTAFMSPFAVAPTATSLRPPFIVFPTPSPKAGPTKTPTATSTR